MMSTFCKLFSVFCIVFSVGFLAVAPVMANSLFTVDGVEIDVRAENAIKAREQAFEQAQLKAFGILSERMLSVGESAQLKAADPLTISTMIQDFEVRDEKLSAKRYSAIYKFRFKGDDVREFLSGRGLSYTDIAKKPMLILPFLQKETGTVLWSSDNFWMQAWVNSPVDQGLVPLITPIGDLSDVRDIDDEAALNYDPRKLSSMLARYGAGEAVIAIAEQKGEGVDVQIYRTDRATPEYVHQILQPMSRGGPEHTYRMAVRAVKAVLREDWKSNDAFANRVQDQMQVGHAGQASIIRVRARFASLDEWVALKSRLAQVDGLSNVELKALSPREAYLDLHYRGAFERLNLALQQLDLALEGVQGHSHGGLYDRFAGGRSDMVYDLVRRAGIRNSYGRQDQPVSDGAYRARF